MAFARGSSTLSESTHKPLRLQQQPVAYSRDQQPLLGPLSGCSNISLFTGFVVLSLWCQLSLL